MAKLSNSDIRRREEAAVARAHEELKRDELREALLFERQGYLTRGLPDRVRQVDAQLKAHGFPVPRGPKGSATDGGDSGSGPDKLDGKAPGGGDGK